MDPLLIGIICLFTLLNINSFFVMALKSPVYTIFTGAIHYPSDYLYYLSFISQGVDHWLRSYHLFTGETNTLEYLNWIYVLGGHVGSLFHLSPSVIYLFLVVFGSIVYLIAAYRLMKVCIPKNYSIRMLAYILFLLSNAVPNIYKENGNWIFTYFYPFNNLGHPFLRLGNVPHHLFIQCFILLSIYQGIYFWQQKKTLRMAGWMAFLGILLSGTQPLQWAYVTGILGITGIFAWWKTYRGSSNHAWFKELLFTFSPAFIFGLSGIIPALYLQHLYTLPPNNSMIQWEALQQVYISFSHFLRLNGPVMILGIIGLPFVVRKMSIATFPVLFYMISSIIIFFSPIPSAVHILNLRFITVIPTFAAAYISASILWWIAKLWKKMPAYRTAWFLGFLLIAITLPVTVHQLYDRTNNAPPQDINAFLPMGAAQTYNVAKKVIGPTDTVLVDFLFSASFAGHTGKHVFVATRLGTIDFDRKLAEANAFFYTLQTKEEKIAWLTKNNISYIFTFAWHPLDIPNLKLIDSNAYALLYKVQ